MPGHVHLVVMLTLEAANGLVHTVTEPDPDGTGSQVAPVTTFEYGARGRVEKVINPDLILRPAFGAPKLTVLSICSCCRGVKDTSRAGIALLVFARLGFEDPRPQA